MRSFFALILSWFKKLIARITGKTEADPDVTTSDENTDDPGSFFDGPIDGPGDVVCYYGCPNSNKAKKLQLNKNLYK